MGVVNEAKLLAIATANSILFNRAFQNSNKDYEKLATVIKTNSHTIDYHWLGDIPAMTEWVGERTIKDLTAFNYSISKKDWEASFGVTRDDIIFDRLGIIKPKVEQLAHAIPRHRNKLVSDLITNNGVCYDGKAFFGEHTIGDTTYNNKSTDELNGENLLKAYAFMESIKNENGESLEVSPSHLVVSANLRGTAQKLLKGDIVDNNSNPVKDLVPYSVMKNLPANSWCLMDLTQPIKPFIVQITKDAELVRMDQSGDELMFMKKEARFGIDCMDNAGYSLWQLAYFSDGSGVGE
jgi:phage major head subunit gpT-like protein